MPVRPRPGDRLTCPETTRLLRESDGRVLALAFGPSGVWLERDAEECVISAWAPPLLALWRDQAFGEGGGI